MLVLVITLNSANNTILASNGAKRFDVPFSKLLHGSHDFLFKSYVYFCATINQFETIFLLLSHIRFYHRKIILGPVRRPQVGLMAGLMRHCIPKYAHRVNSRVGAHQLHSIWLLLTSAISYTFVPSIFSCLQIPYIVKRFDTILD